MKTLIFSIAVICSAAAFSAETKIKGGKMTLFNQGEKIVFTGGVTLTRDGDVLKASRMETNKERDKVKATGNVDLYRTLSATETLRGYGAEGFYESKIGRGFLEGRSKKAHVIYTEIMSSTQTRKLDLFAKRFDFASEKESAVGKGDVYGKTIDPEDGSLYQFWADQADYNGDEKKVILTGETQPKVLRTLNGAERRVRGEKITFFLEEKRFIAEGNAEGFFLDPEDEKSEAP